MKKIFKQNDSKQSNHFCYNTFLWKHEDGFYNKNE